MARLGRALALIGMVLVLSFYAEVLVHAPVTGQDFRNFYAAATLLRRGGNPYDARAFQRQEELLYHPTTRGQRASLAGNPYVQGPPLAIALIPLTALPPSAAYYVYAGLLVIAATVAIVLLARLWPTRRPAWRAFVLLISPVTFAGMLLGQPDAMLLLLLVSALWWLDRKHPMAAGFVLTLGLVKPQIMAGPIILLAMMAWRREKLGRYLVGLAAGVVIFLGVSLLVGRPAVVSGWVRELAGFSGGTVYGQVDISSATTLYVAWAPHAVGAALALAMLVAWAAVCVLLWRERGARENERRWLVVALTLWLLATPYAHPHDDIVLLSAMWYLLDRGPYRGIVRPLAALMFLTWWLLPLMSVLGLRAPLVRGLGIVPILLLLIMLLMQQTRGCAEAVPMSTQAEAAA